MDHAKQIGIVLPVYAWGVPEIMAEDHRCPGGTGADGPAQKWLAVVGFVLLLLVILAGAFFWYVSDSYRAEDVALEVMVQNKGITVQDNLTILTKWMGFLKGPTLNRFTLNDGEEGTLYMEFCPDCHIVSMQHQQT